ncbi:MAG TPA: alpha/beta hydrolase family protein [Armatimonadota bacterium]
MPLVHVNYFSKPLAKQSALYAILPEGQSAPYRVIYMLHGLSDDYTIWQRRTSIERYADRYGLMIVMLDGARSFYCDVPKCQEHYEQHVLESIRLVDGMFRTVPEASSRGIGGLSMGGYGAMKLGLKYPELFGSVAAHSGALDITDLLDNSDIPGLDIIFGKQLDPSEDCFALAARPGPKPALRFDCGVDDHLLEHNRRFHDHLERLGIKHTYKEYPGSHTWDYWDTHVQAALQFHRQHLKGK